MPSSVTLYRDSTRSVSLNSLPEEAWRTLVGAASDQGEVTDLFAAVPWVYRSIQMRAQALSALPFAVVRGETDLDLDALDYMRGFVQLLYRMEQSLNLYGAAYVLPQANRVKTLGFKWLSPPTITPIFDGDKGLVKFERRLPGKDTSQEYKPDELIYVWLPDSKTEIGPGTSPAQVALAAAGALHGIDLFTKAFFERGAINTTLLQVEGNPPPAEMQKLEAWWKRLLSGVKKAYETVAIRASVKPIVIGSPPKELAMTELTETKRQDIATAFGVPYSLVFSNASNYATAVQDDLNFYTKTIIPQARVIEEALNAHYFDRVGLRFEFRPELMEIFQEIESRKADKLVALLGVGVMTVNEVREQMGLEPLPEQAQDTTEQMPPVEGTATTPGGGASGKAAQADRKRWEKKAIKAVKDGKPAAVAFASEHIPVDEQQTIIAMLSLATTADDVRAVFKRETVDGVGSPLPAADAVTIDQQDIQDAVQEWDETMPDFAGLLDAEVISGE